MFGFSYAFNITWWQDDSNRDMNSTVHWIISLVLKVITLEDVFILKNDDKYILLTSCLL